MEPETPSKRKKSTLTKRIKLATGEVKVKDMLKNVKQESSSNEINNRYSSSDSEEEFNNRSFKIEDKATRKPTVVDIISDIKLRPATNKHDKKTSIKQEPESSDGDSENGENAIDSDAETIKLNFTQPSSGSSISSSDDEDLGATQKVNATSNSSIKTTKKIQTKHELSAKNMPQNVLQVSMKNKRKNSVSSSDDGDVPDSSHSKSNLSVSSSHLMFQKWLSENSQTSKVAKQSLPSIPSSVKKVNQRHRESSSDSKDVESEQLHLEMVRSQKKSGSFNKEKDSRDDQESENSDEGVPSSSPNKQSENSEISDSDDSVINASQKQKSMTSVKSSNSTHPSTSRSLLSNYKASSSSEEETHNAVASHKSGSSVKRDSQIEKGKKESFRKSRYHISDSEDQGETHLINNNVQAPVKSVPAQKEAHQRTPQHKSESSFTQRSQQKNVGRRSSSSHSSGSESEDNRADFSTRNISKSPQKVSEDPLTSFMKQHGHYKKVDMPEAVNLSQLEDDYEVYLLKCTKKFKPNVLKNMAIALPGKTKIKIEDEMYTIEPSDEGTQPVFVVSDCLKKIQPLKCLVLDRSDKLKKDKRPVVLEKSDVTLPETLTSRHACFGPQFKKKIELDPVAQLMLEETIKRVDDENAVMEKKKKKKKQKHKDDEEESHKKEELIFQILEAHKSNLNLNENEKSSHKSTSLKKDESDKKVTHSKKKKSSHKAESSADLGTSSTYLRTSQENLIINKSREESMNDSERKKKKKRKREESQSLDDTDSGIVDVKREISSSEEPTNKRLSFINSTFMPQMSKVPKFDADLSKITESPVPKAKKARKNTSQETDLIANILNTVKSELSGSDMELKAKTKHKKKKLSI